ncbi:MAG: alanine racemase [Mailhella sp.]|nr:alanine racemase [Mailhella sp.]
MPRLLYRLSSLQHNLRVVRDACHEAGTDCMFVLKEAALHPQLTAAIVKGSGITQMGLLSWPELPLPRFPGITLHHIYEPSPRFFSTLSDYSSVCLSSRFVLHELRKQYTDQPPALRLCLECGDGRDGILGEELSDFCSECHDLRFHVDGLLVNFACLSKNAPDVDTLNKATKALAVVRQFWPFADISAGGTDMLEFAEQYRIPEDITEIRCGTGVMLGVYPLSGRQIPGALLDTFELEGCLLEKRQKHGRILALFDFGSYHTAPEKLHAPFEGMQYQGSSSAYSVFDISDCDADMHEGQSLRFRLRHESISRALTSRALPLCEADHA